MKTKIFCDIADYKTIKFFIRGIIFFTSLNVGMTIDIINLDC